MYLAAAGVGTIGVVDDDVVDASNLQRQVVHGIADVGRPKTESAAETVAAINPLVTVVRHDLRLDLRRTRSRSSPTTTSSSTAPTTSRRATSSTTRASSSGMPHVWGSIYRFDGQVSVWFAGHGPCYRCVFPDPPPPDAVPSCATGRRARRAVRGDRVGPGRRGGEAHCGTRRTARRSAPRPRRAAPDVGLAHGARRPRVPGVRRVADRHLAGRLRAVLRYAGCFRRRARQDGADRDGADAPAFAEVSATELAAMLAARDSGDREFELVDVREPGERAVVSIPGARALHLDRFRDGTAADELPPGIPGRRCCASRASGPRRRPGCSPRPGAPTSPTSPAACWPGSSDVDPSLPVY